MTAVLCVEYDDADDLIADYAEQLATGSTCLANRRVFPTGTRLSLSLSFPGLLSPIVLAGVVTSPQVHGERTMIIELDHVARAELATTIARLRDRDPALLGRSACALVVEDNPHVAQLVKVALADARLGLSVCMATDGRSALASLRRQRFDAMVIEVNLPVIDGASLISMVRADREYRDLPILAVSAGGPAAQLAAMNAGANAFLPKPIQIRTVVETMRALVKVDAAR